VSLRIDSRAVEMGLLRTFGFRKRDIRDLFLVESSILSIIGSAVGTVLGLLFGAFVITGLNSFWSPIVEDSSVRFAFTIDDLVIGFCAGCVISIVSLVIGLHHEGRRTTIQAVKRIPYQRKKMRIQKMASHGSRGRILEELLGGLLVVCALIILLSFIEEGSVLMLFFLTGFRTLIGLLLVFHSRLMRIADPDVQGGSGGGSSGASGGGSWSFDYAVRNATRDPKRTMITVILFSLTLFVLVSLTATLQGVMYDRDRAVEEAGGGYEIMGESTNPIFADLGDEQARKDIGIGTGSTAFHGLEIEQFRTKGNLGGTCSNLNRNASPRIIGANGSFLRNNSFPFVRHEDLSGGDRNAWDLLRHQGDDQEIPAIGDYNTVVWILGLELGSTIEIQDEWGNTVDLRIVGIIKNSIFQGSLFIWDGWFDSLYPTDPGYTLFLFRSASTSHDQETRMRELETELAEYGFEARSVEEQVVENIDIENTYISVFLVLLIFGVIIGTLGVGVVVSRNMLERKWELGILRAMGTTRNTLMKIVLMENSITILSGILIGTVAGVMTSWVILATLDIGIATWPWLYIIAMILMTYGFALVSVLIPLFRWSRVTTSEVLRVFE